MMTYHWNVLFFFLIADIHMCTSSVGLDKQSVVHGGVALRSTAAATTPGDISKKTNMTPVQKAQYSLNVTSKGIAALGSSVKFEAELLLNLTYPETLVAGSDRIIYQWMNTATKQLTQTVDGLESSLFVTFDSKNVTAGDYLMTVAAYLNDDPASIVAFETKKFTLTRQLNGLLVLTQKLDYQRHTSTFSTKKPVTLTADVHDEFLQSDLGYEYYWLQDSKHMANTKQSSYRTTFSQPFNSSLASVIMVYTKPRTDSFPDNLLSGIQAQLAGSSDNGSSTESLFRTRALGEEYKGKDSTFLLKGLFLETVAFKDPISECVVTRIYADQKDRAVNVKKEALVNITCAGSAPSSVCVNITDFNTSLPVMHACKPKLFVHKNYHIVTIQLASTGWKDVHFFVYNDISRYQLVESFYFYDPDSVNVYTLTIPIVFGVLGIIIILIGGVYFVRLRKKPLVEVADFDFHPSLTHSQAQGRSSFSRVVNTIRSVLPLGSSGTDNSRSPSHTSFATLKGNDLSHVLYESL